MTVCSFEGIITSVFLDSSMVEHTAVNRGVVGSSPTRGAFKRIWRHGQVVRQRSATPISPVRIWLSPLLTPCNQGVFLLQKFNLFGELLQDDSPFSCIKFSRTGDSENKKTRRYKECQICFAINASRQLETKDV